MSLVRLIYASTRSPDIGLQDVENILSTAIKHNTVNQITGCLCFDGEYFIQSLEGPRDKVNETYDRIYNDKRHRDVVLVSLKEADSRLFEKWSMGFVQKSKLTDSIFEKYSGDKAFEPYNLKIEQGEQFMYELSCSVPIVTTSAQA